MIKLFHLLYVWGVYAGRFGVRALGVVILLAIWQATLALTCDFLDFVTPGLVPLRHC